MTRSAGLLEHGDYGSIDFIHRSALEFLTDTPEGQQIMAHDRSTFSELRSWLLQADVARAYLMIPIVDYNIHVFQTLSIMEKLQAATASADNGNP